MRLSALRLPAHRKLDAVGWFSGITLCKIVLFMLLAKAGYAAPYVGGSARDFFVPTANSIVATGTFGDAAAVARRTKIAPGYPVVVALAKLIGGQSSLHVLVVAQMILDYCVALLLLILGSRETSIPAGWLAGTMWLIFPPAIVISTWVASETTATALLTMTIVMLIRSFAQDRNLRLSFAAGLVLGATTLVRASTQLFPIALFVFSVFDPTRQRRLKCLLLLVGMCVVIAPWTLRNLQVVREPILIQTGYGPVFLMGSRAEYFTIDGMKQHYAAVQEQAASDGLVRPSDDRVTSDDRWIFRLGLREYRLRLQQDPASIVPFVFHKFARLWYGTETGALPAQLVLGVCALFTAPVGLYQIWRWRHDRPHLSLIVGVLVLYFVGLLMVNLPAFRYMLPLYPFLIFGAAHQYLKLFGRRFAC